MSRQESQNLGMRAYLFEPEYSDSELSSVSTEATDSTTNVLSQSVDETQFNLERLTDLDAWCLCSHCCLMETAEECKCCTEYSLCEAKMPNGQQGTCITTHRKFPVLCLDEDVLDLTMTVYHELRGNVRQGPHTNRWYRLAAYRTFTYWIYGRLGVGVRKVIPSCVVQAIRATFLAEDNEYTGFQRSEIQEALSI